MSASLVKAERAPRGSGEGATPKEKLFGASGIMVIVLSGVFAWVFRDSLHGLREQISGHGALGVVLFIGVFALWGLTTLPAIPLIALGGLVYGPWLGALWSLVGTTLAATATFWIGRSVDHERVVRWRKRYTRLAKALKLAEGHPFVAVLVVRSVAVFPLTLLNYGFGATALSFRYFIVYSVILTIPGVAFYSGLGNALYRRLAGEGIDLTNVAWTVGFALLCIIVAVVARRVGTHS